ncbi:hypothetical protein HMPREF0262_03634 [Clostridium sp. ATCC 29733]|nr:hypothetical protein HMPREF0262_03634 [Clostridium sp. ATCC 29733]
MKQFVSVFNILSIFCRLSMVTMGTKVPAFAPSVYSGRTKRRKSEKHEQ